MQYPINAPTTTEFFVSICIEKLSPKYYYQSTSLHPFWVYFANFDFVCVLCAKMQIREHGIKKKLAVQSGWNCRYQLNVILLTQFEIFGFVSIAGHYQLNAGWENGCELTLWAFHTCNTDSQFRFVDFILLSLPSANSMPRN